MTKLNKLIQLLTLVFILCFNAKAQQKVEVDLASQHQTIQGFGASDAWNMEPVGKYWSEGVKEEIAELLFSTEYEGNDAKGIGLSRWRFNIGGGSTEQGTASNIDKEERRSECFIESVQSEVAHYNWQKQWGQQWFLRAAHDYKVKQLVAFVNSPPHFYTKNGRTNSDNSNRYGTTNLASGNYDKFSDFLVTVLKHFSDEGINFSQISPINEPQYAWNSGQEGCPWKHDEVYTLIEKLNEGIVSAGLDTKILLSEAGSYKYLYQVQDDAEKSDIIDNYFNPSSPYYLGGFSQMLKGIGAHSYWVNGSDASISSSRARAKAKADSYGDLEVYQTEYNLLSQHYDDKLTNAIFLAKIIYADLEIAGASIWDYWTAIERERWSQKNRFYLIRLIPNGGNYASLENPGTISVDKNLWALGNFSRFIRPGYQRVSTSGANDLDALMGVSFVSPDQSELVTVYTNWSDEPIDIKQSLKNLPNGKHADGAEVYITDASNDLKKMANHTLSNTFSVPKKSIVTFRVPLLTDAIVDFTPDPNKVYYIDAPIHNLRLAATGESEDAYTTSTNATGADVEWKFIAKGNGSWHIQRAAGGSKPRLRSDRTTNADMQETRNDGDWTYYDFTEGAIPGTYFITLLSGPPDFKRLQIDNQGKVRMVGNRRTGTWVSFAITEVSSTATPIRLEAEDYDAMAGIQTEGSTESGDNVGWINHGDWLRFDDVNLSGLSNMKARIACNFTGGTIEVRTGAVDGSLLGTMSISNTGGNQAWETKSISLSGTDGVHDVYLVFKGGSGYLFNVNWIEFTNSAASRKNIIPTATAPGISIYPNPVVSTITIQNATNSTITIYDITGSVVLTQNISSESELIDLSGLRIGIYYTEVVNETTRSMVKLVKK